MSNNRQQAEIFKEKPTHGATIHLMAMLMSSTCEKRLRNIPGGTYNKTYVISEANVFRTNKIRAKFIGFKHLYY